MGVNYRLPREEGKRYACAEDAGDDGVGQPQTPTAGSYHLDPVPVHCDPLALPLQAVVLPKVLGSQELSLRKSPDTLVTPTLY